MPLLTLIECFVLTISQLTLTFVGLAYITLHLSFQSLHILFKTQGNFLFLLLLLKLTGSFHYSFLISISSICFAHLLDLVNLRGRKVINYWIRCLC